MQINIPVFYFYVEASWGFCRLVLFLLRLLTVTKFSTVGDLVGMVDDAFIGMVDGSIDTLSEGVVEDMQIEVGLGEMDGKFDVKD